MSVSTLAKGSSYNELNREQGGEALLRVGKEGRATHPRFKRSLAFLLPHPARTLRGWAEGVKLITIQTPGIWSMDGAGHRMSEGMHCKKGCAC
eukprot:1156756-Pelagomonas_calceolata.AAC.8